MREVAEPKPAKPKRKKVKPRGFVGAGKGEDTLFQLRASGMGGRKAVELQRDVLLEDDRRRMQKVSMRMNGTANTGKRASLKTPP